MILTTNEQVFNTIFKGHSASNVYWRVLSGGESGYRYSYCTEEGVIEPNSRIGSWNVDLRVASEFAYKPLNPNYKDEGAIINTIRLMARRFEKQQQRMA